MGLLFLLAKEEKEAKRRTARANKRWVQDPKLQALAYAV
jgi:hypothetical protein